MGEIPASRRALRDGCSQLGAGAFSPAIVALGGFGQNLLNGYALIKRHWGLRGGGNLIETHEHAGEFKGDFVTRLGKRHARG